MIKNIKIKKEHKLIIVISLLFLFIAFLTPLSGDDWGNYCKYDSLIAVFRAALSLYQTWEGRLVSRIFIFILTYNKIIWNILLPVCITSLVMAINKFSNKDKKYIIFLLSVLGLLIINNTMFSQVYSWVAGSITYLYPTVIVFSYFSFLFTNKKKRNIPIFITLILINILGPMFVENIGVALVFGNILYFIYYLIINKKIDIKTIIFTLISLTSLIIMLKSPGSMARMELNKDFYDLSILERILSNKYQLMNYTYTRNIYMIVLMIIPIFYTIFSKIKSKKTRLISGILFSIIPIITIINHVLSLINIELIKVGINVESNLICFIYWVIFTILYILSILFSKMDKENKINTLFMFFIGSISICSLLVTPVFGDRASFFTVVVFVAVSLKLISYLDIKIPKFIENILKIIFGLIVVFYLMMFILIAVLEHKRVEIINKELDNNSNVITLKSNPIPFLWNNNPSNEFHLETFKNYYKIPNEVDVNIEWIYLGG